MWLKLILEEYYFIENQKSQRKCFVFCSTAIYQAEMVRSSFNIQYQSTGVGPLPSLSEIELRRSIQVVCLRQYGTFRWTHLVKIFSFGNIDTVTGTCTSKIIVNKANTSIQLTQQSTVCLQMRCRLIYGSYVVSKWLKMCFTVPSSWSILN